MYFRFKTGDFFSKSTAKVLFFTHTAKYYAQKPSVCAQFGRFVQGLYPFLKYLHLNFLPEIGIGLHHETFFYPAVNDGLHHRRLVIG